MSTDHAADERAIERVIALYGHLLDERRWSRLDELFLQDATYDATAVGYGLIEGLDAMRDSWSGPGVTHPVGHHATNILIEFVSDDEADVVSKGIAIFADDSGRGPASSVVYRDRFRRTEAGWRIALRRAERRKPSLIPEPS